MSKQKGIKAFLTMSKYEQIFNGMASKRVLKLHDWSKSDGYVKWGKQLGEFCLVVELAPGRFAMDGANPYSFKSRPPFKGRGLNMGIAQTLVTPKHSILIFRLEGDINLLGRKGDWKKSQHLSFNNPATGVKTSDPAPTDEGFKRTGCQRGKSKEKKEQIKLEESTVKRPLSDSVRGKSSLIRIKSFPQTSGFFKGQFRASAKEGKNTVKKTLIKLNEFSSHQRSEAPYIRG